ncbi:MAG: ATP-binding protein [Armatimonadetes bacterium]|nr:ATP-binding protein [Armatimonadota bacterium]
MGNGDSPAQVELIIPCRPEFVGVARLVMLGVASRMRFSYDEVEDIRLAVGEACTTSVEWAERNRRSDSTIVLRSEITPDKLTVDIIDTAGSRKDEADSSDDQDKEDLGALLITLLVDEIKIEPGPDGTRVRMVKHVGQR